MLGNDAMGFLKTLHKLDEIWKQHDNAEYNERQLTQFAERYHEHKLKLLSIDDVSSSVSVPAVRVRFYPKDTDETYDGTVIEETQYSYLVAPDDNLTATARWNKKCCDVLR